MPLSAVGFASATSNLQLARYYLGCMTTLTDGYFALDYGTAAHGQTWEIDETDGGQGTALAAQMTAASTTLSL